MSNEHVIRIPSKRIWVVGLAAMVASVVANLIVLFVVKALLDLPSNFQPLQPGAIVFFTIMGTLLATVAFWIISRISNNPIRIFQIVAVIALILSVIPNIGLMLNPSAMPMPGATSLAAGVLILFHLVAAAICIWLFSTRTQGDS